MKPETEARLAALRERMVATETGLVAVAPGSHMQWLLGFTPASDERACLLLPGSRSTEINRLLPVFDRGQVAIITDGDAFLGLITRIDLLNYLRRRAQ